MALNGLPAAGDFDGNSANGDEVALKVGNIWYLDKNHSLTVDDSEKLAASNMVGYPIVGDFDGDGIDDLGRLDGRRVLAGLEPPGGRSTG